MIVFLENEHNFYCICNTTKYNQIGFRLSMIENVSQFLTNFIANLTLNWEFHKLIGKGMQIKVDIFRKWSHKMMVYD